MSTKTRRQREAQERRRTILSAAKKLFFKNGYADTTMPQIAAAAELAPGTVYLYFPGKDALYVELLIEGYGLLRDRLAEEAKRHANPDDRASKMIDAFFAFAHEYPEYFDIIFFVLQRERSGGWEGKFPLGQVQRLVQAEADCIAILGQALTQKNSPSEFSGDQPQTIDAVWSMLMGVVLCFGSQATFTPVSKQAKKIVTTVLPSS